MMLVLVSVLVYFGFSFMLVMDSVGFVVWARFRLVVVGCSGRGDGWGKRGKDGKRERRGR